MQDDVILHSLGTEELGALASQALVAAASDHAHAEALRTQGHAYPEEQLQRHAEVTRILSEGRIISAARNKPSQFGHESFCMVVSSSLRSSPCLCASQSQ